MGRGLAGHRGRRLLPELTLLDRHPQSGPVGSAIATLSPADERPHRLRRMLIGLWAGLIVLGVAVPAFGGFDGPWPFVRWTMFSRPGPVRSDAITVVAVDRDGTERSYEGPTLPGGFVRDLYQPRWNDLGPQGRQDDCRRMRRDLAGPTLTSVRIELWTWTLLDRSGDRPARVDREVLITC